MLKNMFLRKELLLISAVSSLIGCDKIYTYSIINKSGDNLIVEATYTKSYVDLKNIEKSLLTNSGSEHIIDIDTMNYKVKLRLPHNEEFFLGFRTNGMPNLEHNKEVSVFKNDSLVFYGNQYIIQNLYTNSNQDQAEVINIY